MYHLVFPVKYRQAVFDDAVEDGLRNICVNIGKRYELKFLEIGTDKDHMQFLVQSVQTYSTKKIVQMIKILRAREIFRRCPQVNKKLLGGEFWSDGCLTSTVGKHGDEATISKYVKGQGGKY